MKKLLSLLAAVVGLSVNAATFSESYTIPYNSTNTVFSNAPIVLKTLSFYNPSIVTATIRFYDSTTNKTFYTNTTDTTNLHSVARVAVTEFWTNGVFSFTTAAGHTTNIVNYITNTTYMLKTIYTNLPPGSYELSRLASFSIPASTTVAVKFDDVNLFILRGLTVANVTGATNVVLQTIYTR